MKNEISTRNSFLSLHERLYKIIIRRPAYLTNLQMLKIRQMFREVAGNARVFSNTELCWSVPMAWFNVYLPLYMLSLGVTKLQVGWVASTLIAAQTIGTALGGYFADKWGRKFTVMLFDVVGWGIPIVLWLFARNVWFFVVAAFINGISWIVIPAWNCLYIEDVPPDKRPAAFALIQMAWTGAGMFTPLAGLMVIYLGVQSGTQLMLAIGMITITTALIIRGKYLRESEVARSVLAHTRHSSFKEAWREYLYSLKILTGNPIIRILFLVQVFGMFQYSMWNTYSSIFMTDVRGLRISESAISLLPVVSSIIMVVGMLLIVPHIKQNRLPFYLILSAILGTIGRLIFAVTPAQMFSLLIFFSFFSGISFSLGGPIQGAYLANLVGNRERAKVESIRFTITSVLTLPVGPVGGYLYALFPRSPFILLFITQFFTVFLLLRLPRTLFSQQANSSAADNST